MTEWQACLDFSPGQSILGPEGHVLHTPDAGDLVPAQATMLFPQLHHHFSLGFKLPAATQTSACMSHTKTGDRRKALCIIQGERPGCLIGTVSGVAIKVEQQVSGCLRGVVRQAANA